jgi:hypothetical protein
MNKEKYITVSSQELAQKYKEGYVVLLSFQEQEFSPGYDNVCATFMNNSINFPLPYRRIYTRFLMELTAVGETLYGDAK